MISIRKAGDELERIEAVVQGARDSYRLAVLSTAQYAIELDRTEADQFREHLHALEGLVERAQSAEDWKRLQGSFRAELRDYHERSGKQVTSLRQQIRVASEAFQLFAENVAVIDADHEAQLKAALRDLNVIAGSPVTEAVSSAIRAAVNTITESIQLMRRRHQTAIAELRQEIQVLHKHIEVERRAHLLDSATGVWNRQKLEAHVAGLFEKDKAFCILLVCVRNLPRLDVRYARSVVDGALKALLQRFTAMLPDGAVIGRWDERNFAAILELDPATAIAVSRLAAKKLAGDYSAQENGISQTITLQAAAGVTDRACDCDEPSFRKKLLQMSAVLSEG